jgi:hypothetical protein
MEEKVIMNASVVPGVQQMAIKRRQGLTRECIYREHLSDNGGPVILTDAIKGWPALVSWSFPFFRQRYGSETVVPGIGAYGHSRRVMKLAHFIDYVEQPSLPPHGFWIDLKTGLPREETPEDRAAPLYLYDQNAFLRHSRLLEDVKPDPECLDDWLALLPERFQRLLQATRYYQRGLLIGPEGSVSRLHCDFLYSHAYLAQIAGRKLCMLFSPTDSGLLYDGEVNPEQPDLEKFPLFRSATAFVCILEPGEMLLIPSQWWHHVRNLEKSITVNYNFFNRANFGEYFLDLFRVMPQLLSGFEKVPGWQDELGVKWKSEGFQFPAAEDQPTSE